jgi:hypothetical protein
VATKKFVVLQPVANRYLFLMVKKTPAISGGVFYFVFAASISSHMAFKMANVQASPKPKTQEKYHMVPPNNYLFHR